MLRFVDKDGSICCVDDRDEVQYEVEKPAVLFDSEGYVLIKIGDYKLLEEYQTKAVTETQKTGQGWLTNTWFLWELPEDVELMNKLLDTTGYLKKYLSDKNFVGVSN